MSGIDHSRALTRRYKPSGTLVPDGVGIHLSGGYGELAPIFHARRLPRRFGSLNGLLTWDYGGLDRLVGLTATVTHELYANGARKTGLTWRFMGGCVWKHEESRLVQIFRLNWRYMSGVLWET